MELSTYIATTISEVMKGASEAAAAANEHGGSVNPGAQGVTHSGATEPHLINDLVLLDFDVAVLVRDSASGGAGAKLSVLGIGGNVAGQLEHEAEHSNRLRFTIPIQLPVGAKIGAFTRVAKRKASGG